MRLSVLILLSVLSVQGRGCSEFLMGVVENLLIDIKSQKSTGFREVFPRNYEFSHYYNDTLLCDDDPCCVFRAAAILSKSWSELLTVLWRENLKYAFIRDLVQQLDVIYDKKFLKLPDISNLPSVSSSPEVLLTYTEAVFSKWLEQKCGVTENICTFPTLLTSLEEEDPHERITEWKRMTTFPPYVQQKRTHLNRQAQLTDGSVSIQSLNSVCGHLSLFWALQKVIF
uniref:Zgc:174888 n=1 Tax=Scleropages formosus TaxID=113540 RepID=A0A8C9QR68_SCLFO